MLFDNHFGEKLGLLEWLPKAAAAGGVTTTLNPSDKSANITLSNGDLTATTTVGSVSNVRSVASYSSGKYYFEVTIPAGSNGSYSHGIGVANSTASLSAGPGSPDTNSVCLFQGDATIYAAGASTGVSDGSYGNGDVISVAVDMGNSRIWYRKNGGDWNANPANNPATNTGGADISAVSKPWFAIFEVLNDASSSSLTVNFGATAYTYTAPSGFGNMTSASHAGEMFGFPFGITKAA